LDRSELRNWYAASIATAFPTSHHEGLGRITLESQAMETPPVAYDIGGVREGFVAEKTGLLIRLGDVAALAHALGRLAADEAERLAMGLGGRDFVRRHFSFSALAERHEQLLLTLAVKRRRINPPSATLPSPCAS
jgi:glycosyltransferase involved in cell wall biosynthesis